MRQDVLRDSDVGAGGAAESWLGALTGALGVWGARSGWLQSSH